MMFQSNNPALVIIDCQLAIDEFDSFERSNLEAEDEISKLLWQWREHQWPVIHVRHSSKFVQSPYHATKATYAFKEQVMPLPSEVVITKSENCAFAGTDLETVLSDLAIAELVICGVLSHHSVAATVIYGAALGYRILVPENCTASFSITTKQGRQWSSELVQDIYLTNLDGEYCQVVDKVSIK